MMLELADCMSLVILIPTLLRGNQFIKIQQNMNNDNNRKILLSVISALFFSLTI
jgi:hypothetical protein